ncbi:hypothetical protein AC481_02135 [miscellaneous Crenarchaeota group archaeon SMTZ-80]|nr:MAG: hypothetical protein AC481_02135 [miscellaneous Crenarchaeota group archaeon SMTZ-80]
MDTKVNAIFNNFLSNNGTFLDRDVLRHDYIPENLPHRDEQINSLAGILAPTLASSKISNVFIYGKNGTGKTAVTKFVLEHLEQKTTEIGANLRILYINCRLAGTNYRVLAEICRTLGTEVPFTGLAIGELFNRFLNSMIREKCYLIVVLDEIDALVKKEDNNNLLYELTRVNENLHNIWVGLICISNDLHFKEFLDPRVLSCLSEEEVVFKPYLANELYDILLIRSKKAFFEDIVDESSIRLCAALAAREHGDARRALDLLRVAGEQAEREGIMKITEKHIKLAQQKIEHDRISETLSSLPLHSKITVIGTYLLNNYMPKEGVITGNIYEIYKELCKLIEMEPLTQRRISGLINELDLLGILNSRLVSYGRYGRTKKIRLGIPVKTINTTFSGDDMIKELFTYIPKNLPKKRHRN